MSQLIEIKSLNGAFNIVSPAAYKLARSIEDGRINATPIKVFRDGSLLKVKEGHVVVMAHKLLGLAVVPAEFDKGI